MMWSFETKHLNCSCDYQKLGVSKISGGNEKCHIE